MQIYIWRKIKLDKHRTVSQLYWKLQYLSVLEDTGDKENCPEQKTWKWQCQWENIFAVFSSMSTCPILICNISSRTFEQENKSIWVIHQRIKKPLVYFNKYRSNIKYKVIVDNSNPERNKNNSQIRFSFGFSKLIFIGPQLKKNRHNDKLKIWQLSI